MTRPSYKLIITALLLLFPVCATARAQYHESPKQLAAEQAKADQDALTAWNNQCKTAFDSVKPIKHPNLLTGPDTGYYHMVGVAISNVVAQKTSHDDGTPLEIQAIGINQTSCNLLGLETKNADFALVQSDIAHDAWYGHPPVRSAPTQEITLVAPLYVEAVHIVVRPHLNLAHLSDLRGRHVYLGRKGSLTVLSAKRILDAAGLTHAQVDELDKHEVKPDTSIKACKNSHPSAISDLDPDCALVELERFDLDAVFQVGPVPFDGVHDEIVPSDTKGQLLAAQLRQKKPCDAVRKARSNDPSLVDSELHLFNLDVDLVERLVADGSYIEQLIPPDAYCQDKAALTVGVRALLLTNRDISDPIVRRLASAINLYLRDIETNLREQVVMEQQAHGDAITGLPSRLSLLRIATPDALLVRYHPTITAGNIYFNYWKERAKRYVPICGILIFSVFAAVRWQRRLGPWVARRGGFALGLAAPIILLIVASLWLMHIEGNVNEDFNGLLAAMLSTLEGLIPFIPFGNGPVTQKGQELLTPFRWFFIPVCSIILFPTIRRGAAKVWGFVKSWLLRLGSTPTSTPTPAPAPDPSSASDQGVPSPTH